MAHVPLNILQEAERILKSDVVVAACALTGEEKHAQVVSGIGDALNAIARPSVIQIAQERHQTDELEIDSDAGTSPSDEGTWVQAWVWLDYPDCETCDGSGRDEEDQECSDCGGVGRVPFE